MSSVIVKQQPHGGFEEIESTSGGVYFFMSWTRLEKALGPKRPELPELKKNEYLEVVKADEAGLHVYVGRRDG